MINGIDHVMMRVEDLESSLDWYKSNFGFVEPRERTNADTFTNVFLEPPDDHPDTGYLELTYNHDGRSYELGDAWGHVALRVEDVYEAYDRLMANGVTDYRDPESCGGRYAFVEDPDGHEIELIERDDCVQWSLDHVMWRVENVDEAIGWFSRKFDYELQRRWEADTFANYFVGHPERKPHETVMELTYNYDGRTYTMGDGWGHIAVRVEDLHEAWDTLMEREAENYRPPAECGNEYAFTKSFDGHEIDLHAH
jgi:lactoylglutathione lyase